MSKPLLPSHLALFAVALIYGLNYTVAKGVMPDYVQPFGFIFLRGSGALILFWALSLFLPSEKIERKDWLRLAACGAFGVACNQLLFFKGLSITTPINASIIMTTNPILVLVASSLMLRERITTVRVAGIALGMIGALMLISFGGSFGFGSETVWGDLMIFCNAMSYGIYLVLVKPLMLKYSPLTVIKWVFAFGFLIVCPVGFEEFSEIEWSTMPTNVWLAVIFVVLFTTFFAYLLNIFAMKRISPTTVSTYIYLQPVVATTFALLLGQDSLEWTQVLSALLIFGGVYLVSKPSAVKK